MATLVNQWVLQKLGIPIPEYSDPSELRKGLSNGYIFAEILRKYCVISDDQLIALKNHTSTEQAKLKNMKDIHRWMSEAGIRINFSEFLDVAEDKPGAVVKFLYKLYFALERSYRAGAAKISQPEDSDFIPHPDFDYGIEPTSFLEARSHLEMAEDERTHRRSLLKSLPTSNEEKDESTLSPPPNAQTLFPPIPGCISSEKIGDVDQELKAQLKIEECPLPTLVPPTKSDTREATKLYFVHQAAAQTKHSLQKEDDMIKQWKKQKKNLIYNTLSDEKLRIDLTSIDFSGLEEKQRKMLNKMKAKLETEFRLANDMESFDQELIRVAEEAEKSGAAGEMFRIPANKVEPVRPNDVEWQIRVNRLKCEKREEKQNSEDRIRLRKAFYEKLIKTIPQQIHEDLVNTALAKTQNLCTKEVELTEFLVNTHNRSKSIFLEHLRLEEIMLQDIRIQREDQLQSDKIRKEETHLKMVEMNEKRDSKIEGERSEKELALLLKMISTQLTLMIRLATRIGDYRSANGGEDPSEEMIAEWKEWLLLGLETPPEEDSDEDDDDMPEMDLADGICHIILSETPIPVQLRPSALQPHPSHPSHSQLQLEQNKAKLKISLKDDKTHTIK